MQLHLEKLLDIVTATRFRYAKGSIHVLFRLCQLKLTTGIKFFGLFCKQDI